MPLVSVIMPSYNHEAYISDAIQSVLDQSLEDIELVVIDDASQDSSRKIIESFKGKDERISSVFHKRNLGIARTLNEGIKRAKGKFIALIASDDVWSRDKLKRQMEVLEKDDDLIVWSEGEIIDACGNSARKSFTELHMASRRDKSGNILEELLKGNFIFGSSLILKRENLGSIKFNEALKYLNDYQFMVDLANRYEYFFIPVPLAKYRIHGKNSINSDRESWCKDGLIVGRYFLDNYGEVVKAETKARILGRIGTSYVESNDRKNGRRYIYQAVRTNPFDPLNLTYMALILTEKDGNTRKILRRIHCQFESIAEQLI